MFTEYQWKQAVFNAYCGIWFVVAGIMAVSSILALIVFLFPFFV